MVQCSMHKDEIHVSVGNKEGTQKCDYHGTNIETKNHTMSRYKMLWIYKYH